MIAIVVVASFLIAIIPSSSVIASSHFDCEFSVNNGSGLGPIPLISESQVAGGEQLDCICANSSVQLEFILPSGAVEDGMTNDLISGSDSLSISPMTGALPNGVYTCRINGTQEIHAYILPATGLTTSFTTQCSMTSTDPLMFTLSAQLTGLVPQTVTCTADEGSPMVIADPGISIVDRMVSTTTDVSVSFAPTGTMGLFDCAVSTAAGFTVNFRCNYTSTISGFIDAPSSFTATLNSTDPSSVMFSWEPSMSPLVDGYTITISSMDGTVVRTVSVPSTETSTIVMNLDTNQQLSAVISPTSTTPDVNISSSDPIMIPTADNNDFIDAPSSFTATLNSTDPSSVMFSWEPSMSPLVDGYTITISSMDGTVVRTVSIPSTETSTIVMNLDTNQQLSAIISPTSSTPNVNISSSDPIMIPTAPDQCKPAQGFTFKLCLTRSLRDDENATSCDCNVTGFVDEVINNLLQSSCIQNSTGCSSPMILPHEDDGCICESKEKTKSKRRDEKSPGRGKGKKKGKKGKDKTMKTGRMDDMDDETTIEVCVEGTLLCGSCDPMMETTPRQMTGGRMGGPRPRPGSPPQGEVPPQANTPGGPRGRPRGRRQGRQRGRGGPNSRPKSGTLRLDEDCPGMLSVQGSDYTTELKVDKKSDRYCGDVQTTGDSCDCPDSCN